MNFVTIDFETANQMPLSACSVGLARFDEDGRVLDTFYTLLKPPKGYDHFYARNIEIHGITPRDVSDAHDFEYIWPEIEYFIGNDFVVAHNAQFDMNVLKALLEYYGCPDPELKYLCSLQISRKVWPNFRSHALTSLSEQFGLEYNAHNALDDAINCGKVFIRACNGKLFELQDLRKFLIVRGIEFKTLSITSLGR